MKKAIRGITLIETIVTVAIIFVVLGAISGSVITLYRTHKYTLEQSQAITEARRGVETMVKEIREAVPGDDGAYVIELAQDYEFIFYSDIDKDEAAERVRYFIDDTDFKKGVINPSAGWPVSYPLGNEEISILSRYIRNQPPVFHYFNGDGDEITELPARLKDTKLMRVYLVINVDPAQPPQNYELSSDIQIRNLKTNL